MIMLSIHHHREATVLLSAPRPGPIETRRPLHPLLLLLLLFMLLLPLLLLRWQQDRKRLALV
jgi:hypothetical protein